MGTSHITHICHIQPLDLPTISGLCTLGWVFRDLTVSEKAIVLDPNNRFTNLQFGCWILDVEARLICWISPIHEPAIRLFGDGCPYSTSSFSATHKRTPHFYWCRDVRSWSNLSRYIPLVSHHIPQKSIMLYIYPHIFMNGTPNQWWFMCI